MIDFTTEEKQPLLLFRRVLAWLLGTTMVLFGTDFHSFYSTHGLIDPSLLALKQPFASYSVVSLSQYIASYLCLQPAQSSGLIIGIYLGLCWLFCTQHAFRLYGCCLLLLHISIFSCVSQYSYGVDCISTSLLFYAVCTPSPHSPVFIIWAHTVQIHLCIIYFFGGFDKAMGFHWWDGDALWKALNLPYFKQDFNGVLQLLGKWPWLTRLLSWAIVLIELLYPLAVCIRPMRRYGVYAICLVHVGIALLMGLYFFSSLMILWNALAFVFIPSLLSAYYPQYDMFYLSRISAPTAPVPDRRA